MSLICIPVYSCEWERGEVTASGQEIIILYMVTVAQTIKNLPAVQETWVGPLSQEDPLEKGMATFPCLENPRDRGAWKAIVHGVTKSRTKRLVSNYHNWGCTSKKRDTFTK